MLAQRVSKGVLSIGTWTIGRIVASAIFTPLLSRILGTEGYGQYMYFLAVILLASPLANLGTSQSMIKHIAEEPEDGERAAGVARVGLRYNILGSIVSGILVTIVVLRGTPQGVDPALFAAVMVGIILLDQVFYYSRGILFGLHQESLATVPASLGAFLSLLIGVLLAIAGYGVFGVMVGLLLGNAGVALATAWLARRAILSHGSRGQLQARGVESARIVRFGLSYMLFSAVGMLLYKNSLILVRNIVGSDSQTGLYATALQMSEFVWVLPLAVEGVMLQTTASLWARGQIGEISAVLSRFVRYASLAVSWILLMVFLFGETILALYFGPRYAAAGPALRILIPGVFALSLARVIWPVAMAGGRVLPVAGIMAGAAAAGIAGSILLIPVYGIVGAAFATSFSYASVVVFVAWILNRGGVNPFSGFKLFRQVGLLAVTAIVLITVDQSIAFRPAALGAGFLCGALVYWGGAFRLGLLTTLEIRELLEGFPTFLKLPAMKMLKLLQPLLVRIEPR
jgi:O-antigen/teichoic acid export membrane protein